MPSSKTTDPRVALLGDKTLTKGLQILEALVRSAGPRGVSELAKELSLTKSNVHRLIQTLVSIGYVTQDVETDRYQLSAKLWRLSRTRSTVQCLARSRQAGFAGGRREDVR